MKNCVVRVVFKVLFYIKFPLEFLLSFKQKWELFKKEFPLLLIESGRIYVGIEVGIISGNFRKIEPKYICTGRRRHAKSAKSRLAMVRGGAQRGDRLYSRPAGLPTIILRPNSYGLYD